MFPVNCDAEILEAYEQGLAVGAASVDITSDNQSVADEAYGWGYGDGYGASGLNGAASVDITVNMTAFDEGAACYCR